MKILLLLSSDLNTEQLACAVQRTCSAAACHLELYSRGGANGNGRFRALSSATSAQFCGRLREAPFAVRCDTCGLAGSFFFPGKRRGFAIPVADAGVVFFSVEFCHTVRRAGETQIAGTRRFVGSDPFYSVAKLIRVAVSSRYTGNGLSVLRLY